MSENQRDILRDLAIRSQQGDRTAYTEFLKKITPYIQGAVRKKLGSFVDQEDVLQECLMGIHKNLATYHPSQPIKPWISAIIRYKLADHFRKLSKRKEELLKDGDSDVTNLAVEANSTEERSSNEASEVLKALPDKMRRALEMTHIQGLSYGEAAAKEGISEVALRKRISRAFMKVKTVVEKTTEIKID